MKKKACYGADGGRHRYPVTPLRQRFQSGSHFSSLPFAWVYFETYIP